MFHGGLSLVALRPVRGFGVLVRLRFALLSFALGRVCAIAPSWFLAGGSFPLSLSLHLYFMRMQWRKHETVAMTAAQFTSARQHHRSARAVC
jgi:hypothetical protein